MPAPFPICHFPPLVIQPGLMLSLLLPITADQDQKDERTGSSFACRRSSGLKPRPQTHHYSSLGRPVLLTPSSSRSMFLFVQTSARTHGLGDLDSSTTTHGRFLASCPPWLVPDRPVALATAILLQVETGPVETGCGFCSGLIQHGRPLGLASPHPRRYPQILFIYTRAPIPDLACLFCNSHLPRRYHAPPSQRRRVRCTSVASSLLRRLVQFAIATSKRRGHANNRMGPL
ncbi:hypothetical protein V8C44DRAFT_98764 [Trichoderma aethiopicum]